MNNLRDLQPLMNALAAFECAGRHGSFTKAAKELGTSQPAVSRHIANLEDHLNSALFERRHNRIRLTPPGQRLYDAVNLGLSHIQSVFQEIRRARQDRSLSIGCSYDLAHLYVMPRFATLQDAFEDREVRIVTTNSYRELDGAGVDYSIRFGAGHWPEMTAVKLFDEVVFPICAPAFLDRHPELGEPDGWRHLPEVPLLHLDEGGLGWLTWEDWLSRMDLPSAPGRSDRKTLLRHYTFLLQAVIEGRGVGLGWETQVGPALEAGQVEKIGPEVVTGRAYYLVCQEGRQDAAITDALQSILAANPR